METVYVWLVIGGVVGSIALVGWVANKLFEWREAQVALRGKAALYDERMTELSSLEEYRKKLDAHRDTLGRQRSDLEIVIAQKSKGFPWLAEAFADYFQLEGMKEADSLRYKKHPAPVAARRVQEIAAKRRQVEAELRVAKYLLHYYENLFPWLVDFRGEDLDDIIERKLNRDEEEPEVDREDPARQWLTEAEYANLSTSEKYQIALDRYWKRRKTSWEIGRDYERYIGYLYEREGFHVYYQGIVEGLADIGRDLIATKPGYVEVIQCKYWSQSKIIHEKHVFQLYGTAVAFRVDHPGTQVKARFVTSTSLSERAKKFAEVLDVEWSENVPLATYPAIKCNVSRRDGQKIYHLPFDQQYDSTVIEADRLERFVTTVQEAEGAGFRRAFRWKGKSGGSAGT